MKKLITIVLLLALSACANPTDQNFADKVCNNHRGVMTVYPNLWPTTIICRDGVEFDVTYAYKMENSRKD